jgi:hypothetical protein
MKFGCVDMVVAGRRKAVKMKRRWRSDERHDALLTFLRVLLDASTTHSNLLQEHLLGLRRWLRLSRQQLWIWWFAFLAGDQCGREEACGGLLEGSLAALWIRRAGRQPGGNM